MNNLLDEALAVVVARMRFAGENELHGTLLVAAELHDVLELLENQRRAFVSRETAREADGERVGIQEMIETDVVALREALALEQQSAAAEFNQFAAQLVTERPEFLVRNKFRVGHFLPELGVVNGGSPVGTEFFAEEFRLAVGGVGEFFAPELADGAFHPAEQMNAVGDVADGHVLFRHAEIKRLPHVAADLAVQFADAVGGARMFQREHGHAERFLRVFRMHAAQGEDFRKFHWQLAEVTLHRVTHQVRREAVVAGLDGRVRGEETFLLGERLRFGECFPGGDFFADQLQREKRRVAFVHVERGRLDAQRAQQPHAADAQQNLLHDARGAVAAINARRQVAVKLLVLRQVRVEQKNRHAPDVDAPDLEVHGVHADLDVADEPFAFRVQHRLERHVVRLDGIVKFRLPVVVVNRLLKITFAVKQTDADEAEAEIAGGFRVVAGEDSEAARRNRQRFVETKFRRKIGDRILVQLRRVLVSPGVLVVQVAFKIAQHRADAVGETGFLQMHAQFVFRDLAQHGHRVVKEILPAARRELVKQIPVSYTHLTLPTIYSV